MELNVFYKQINSWLLPLGYVEIYSNHPCENIREYHFAKDGVRVCCVNAPYESYCYLHCDCIKTRPFVAIITGRYKLNLPYINILHKYILKQANKLEL